AAVKATWTPVAPLRLGRRRAWGQIIAASGRMYLRRAPLFLGIGLLLIPISFVITLVQWLLLKAIDFVGVVTGDGAGTWAFVAAVIGTTFTLLGLGLVMAAAAFALVEIDSGRDIGPLGAYRLAWRRIRPLMRALILWVTVWIVLASTVFLLPIAIWL